MAALPQTMRDVANNVRQRTDYPGPDAEVLPRRSLETYGSHQVPEHKANREDGQRDNNEPGEKRGEHLTFQTFLIESCRFRLVQAGLKTKSDLLTCDPG